MDILKDLLAFLRDSPTPYHAVASAAARLTGAGFRSISETDSWSELAAGKYFVTVGESALAAFVLPASRSISGFRIVGAHTDSPNLRLKPKPEYKKEGYAQLGVEIYGGVLLNSWLDRDLSLAGRVVLREQGKLTTRLLRFDKPWCRVPQLAIHLDRDVNDKGLVLNKQEHMVPVIGLAEGAPELFELCARELKIDRASIVATDLMLYDLVPPTVGGANGEFIFSGRLDNLAMCHAAVSALLEAAPQVDGTNVVPVAVLFDHEEVGSESATGAGSAFLPRMLERIALGVGKSQDDVHRTFASSFCVSADMAHAVHPNYVERHEARHRPVLNGGPVIKVNSQQRYATSSRTAAVFQDLCRAADVPVQNFVNRTDLACGSTIGPITSTRLGIPTVDVGNATLSMHSIREMGGSKDPERMTRVLAKFYVSTDV